MKIKVSLLLLIFIAVLLNAGCASRQTRMKSSVVDYLYSDQSETVVQPSIPVLKIPIKVGIAFVPEQHVLQGRIAHGGALPEANKLDILNTVSDHFQKHEIIGDIEIIPSAYLTAGGGFSNLAQIKSLYGIDVIALLSYDQVQFTDEGFLSLTYWTLIGAYIVSGEKNDTSTILDMAVYDIESKKMLFRAPGTSNVKGRSTPINLSEELRLDSIKSFEEASQKMIANLDIQLEKFKQDVKKNPKQVKVVVREGYSGVGAFGSFEAILVLLLFVITMKSKLRA